MTITADMEHLWHSHHAKIMRYVRHRLNDDVAEDVTQEVYLRAWEAMCDGKGYSEHASGWLYRIAHNVVIDTYRARERGFKEVHLDAIFVDEDGDHKSNKERGEVMLIEDESLEEQVERTLLLEEVGKAVNRLVDTQAFVVLRVLEGYNYVEIGEEMGKHHKAVKQLNVRAMSTLRAQFNPDHVPAAATVRRRGEVNRLAQGVLAKYGPQTSAQMARRIGMLPQTLNQTLIKHPDVFVVVDHVQAMAFKAKIWGLAGIHDRQEAA